MASHYRILFVCVHNSARSQMAEAFLKKYGDDLFEVESAGLTPGSINPNVVEVMNEVGIDLSQRITQDVYDLLRKGRIYNALITVCDQAIAERSLMFPGMTKRLTWTFPDPSAFQGEHEEVLEQTRKVRDEIEESVKNFAEEARHVSYWIK
ncbi:arsenate reductase ArsC [Dinghuibacter silviterrae]|uniref:Protein tyrosine phosphatase n=1 Tax=Dinghuibacter silviterrae TaxID=1539049 RepID=A0A4R8DNT6_9BACT|nr:arsenate reductase ArsC [Dinghuibacter silviterrae]TDW99084.1 protein tyrosine phosphatase [Dinghuibacter silviterrae]